MLFTLLVASVTGSEAVQRTFWEWLLMVAGGITVVSGAAIVVWKVAIRPHFEEFVKKAAEVHKSVTVNGGKNSPPTLRDDVSDLRGLVRQLIAVAGATAQRTSDLGDQIHDLRTLTEDTRQDLADHVVGGEQYVNTVRLMLEQQGIELPGPDE